MFTVGDYYDTLNQIAPFRLAESWDNVGLLVGSRDNKVTKTLIALDVTSKVIDEAIDIEANLIITHHPVIFSPITSISSDSIVYKLIQNGISVISAHTNLDIAKGGVNDSLSLKLNLTKSRNLEITEKKPFYKVIVFVPTNSREAVYSAMIEAGAGKYENYSGAAFIAEGIGRFIPEYGSNPTIGNVGNLENVKESRLEMIVSPDNLDNVLEAIKASHPYEDPGFDIMKTYAICKVESLGRIGELKSPMSCVEFATFVAKSLNATGIRYNETGKQIKTVAVCGGSGGDFIYTALSKGADALVTGEIKHHLLLEAVEKDICIVNAGHFATENVFMSPLKEQLEKNGFNNIYISDKCTDGVLSL